MMDSPRSTLAPIGTREGNGSWFTRILSRATSRDVRVFVIPGEEVARASGLDLDGVDIRVVDTPRHASVLLIVGGISPELERASAIAYAQMPRPRGILAVGAPGLTRLTPDVSVALDYFADGIEEVRNLFARSSFQEKAVAFEVGGVETRVVYTCVMHPEVVRDEPGTCPICGMELVRRESQTDESQAGSHDPHALHEDTAHEDMNHDSESHAGTHDSHESMDHGHMDHGLMDFMSMLEMTKDLPRSRDGLAMERNEGAAFGPFFPGLPGGLMLALTLDGDAVVEAEASSLAASRVPYSVPGEKFVEAMSSLDPLSPVAYRTLALNALEDAGGFEPDDGVREARIIVVERERLASHLGWISSLGRLLGYGHLHSRAASLQREILRGVEVSRIEAEIRALIPTTNRNPFLRRRLRGIGKLPADANISGPVKRASGVASDARAKDSAYTRLGFEPTISDGNDALSRMRVRLAEMEVSLKILSALPQTTTLSETTRTYSPGEGEAEIETPRGVARLSLKVEDGMVYVINFDTPSDANLALIQKCADDIELSEFLAVVASLDVSPWTVSQ